MAKISKIVNNNRKRNSVKHRNRCNNCGRPRGFIRFFGICRVCFRKFTVNGLLPGVTKSSW